MDEPYFSLCIKSQAESLCFNAKKVLIDKHIRQQMLTSYFGNSLFFACYLTELSRSVDNTINHLNSPINLHSLSANCTLFATQNSLALPLIFNVEIGRPNRRLIAVKRISRNIVI